MNIKTLRKKIGKTQEEMANDLDIKTQTLRNYEMGTREPNIKTIIKLATYFNCSIDELIGYKEYFNVEVNCNTSDNIGAQLKTIRKERGYSQEEIAKILDISQSNYSKYEAGVLEMSIKNAIVLSKFYDMEITELFRYEKVADIKNNYVENLSLKDVRKKYNLSQQEMAKIIDVDQKTYSNYENGKTDPTLKTIIKMSNYFGCTLDELVGNKKGANVEISPERKELLQMIDTLTDVECHKLKIFALGMVMNRPEKGE